MWSAPDGRTHLRGAPLSTQGTLLSDYPSLVRKDCDPADASGGLPLCLPARIRHPRPARLDSLAARLGALRRRRRQGADCSVDEVRVLGAPDGWRSLVLNSSRAVADFRALVFYRRRRCPMSGCRQGASRLDLRSAARIFPPARAGTAAASVAPAGSSRGTT